MVFIDRFAIKPFRTYCGHLIADALSNRPGHHDIKFLTAGLWDSGLRHLHVHAVSRDLTMSRDKHSGHRSTSVPRRRRTRIQISSSVQRFRRSAYRGYSRPPRTTCSESYFLPGPTYPTTSPERQSSSSGSSGGIAAVHHTLPIGRTPPPFDLLLVPKG